MSRKKVHIFGRIDNSRAKRRVVEVVDVESVPQEISSETEPMIEQKANISKRPSRKFPPSQVSREGDKQHQKIVGKMLPCPSRRTPMHRKCDIDESKRNKAPQTPIPEKVKALPEKTEAFIVEDVEIDWKRKQNLAKKIKKLN